MAPPAITKNVFLVVLPDYPTPEAKEGRKTFFPAHLESPMVKESGFIGACQPFPPLPLPPPRFPISEN